MKTSENLVEILEGIPLTKASVKTVCRLMIDHIHHPAERAEHGTSYATLLNICVLVKEIDSETDKIF